MTNLEWIDKQILFVKENIQYHKYLLAESDEEYAEEIISAIKLLEPGLRTLQQIKTELEAWEVVKEELQIVFKGKNYYGEPLLRYELNVIGQNKIDTLNKALEANNNENNNS